MEISYQPTNWCNQGVDLPILYFMYYLIFMYHVFYLTAALETVVHVILLNVLAIRLAYQVQLYISFLPTILLGTHEYSLFICRHLPE